jgi:hypothetical protein
VLGRRAEELLGERERALTPDDVLAKLEVLSIGRRR